MIPHINANHKHWAPTMKSLSKIASPKQNLLLAALPPAVYAHWLPMLESVEMPLGYVLYESGTTLNHLYFPTSSIVSMLYVMKNGESAEVAIVGNDGLVGITLFMGGGSTCSRALVQNEGYGYRLPAIFAKQQFEDCKPVMHLFLGFTQALIAQVTQTGACNKHHSLDQQLCRWLLLTLDRHRGMELRMTKQLIANMLGVTGDVMRFGAQKLQDEGLIQYEEGRITVLDRPGVEMRTCECYALVKKEYDRLLTPSIGVSTGLNMAI
jgi:CRP-like cAMP-binding protein